MINSIGLYVSTVGLRGVVMAVLGRIAGVARTVAIRPENVAHPVSLRVPSSDAYTYAQVFVNEEYNFHVETPPRVIVDAGANIGLASIYFANKFPATRIIAIEPEKSNFELLKLNVAPYRNVTPVHAALWNKNEEINLVDPGLGNWGFMTESLDEKSHLGKASHSVNALTVDRVMQKFGIEFIDILKIDIEGAEKEVFEDTSAWLGKVNAVIVELHERMKPGCNRAFYRGSSGFELEWTRGENVYIARTGTIQPV